jgi:hypothetical protein
VVTKWSEWESVRHQVAIGGTVLDEADRPVAGAEIVLTSTPEGFAGPTAGAVEAAKGGRTARLPDRTVSGRFGRYYFLDLPNGRYTLIAVDARTGSSDQKVATVAPAKKGAPKITRVNFKLAPK